MPDQSYTLTWLAKGDSKIGSPAVSHVGDFNIERYGLDIVFLQLKTLYGSKHPVK